MVPLYDNEDSVCGILYNDTPYYFLKNLQGDIIAITNVNGDTVARYSYDAWGVCTIISDTSNCNIATINPFRYRGYYYDEEIAMYYLQSRYYDPAMGRFINTDEAMLCVVPVAHNLYVYCSNNPINCADYTGYHPGLLIAFGKLLAACGLLLLAFGILISITSSPSFKDAWKAFCNSVGNGLSWAANKIYHGLGSAWNWTVNQVQALLAAVTLFAVIVQAHTKIIKTVKRYSKTRYWTATVHRDYVDLGREITYTTAVNEVSAGRNVFTVTAAEASAVAAAAYGNKPPVGPEIDEGKESTIGYYYHYHVYGRRKKGHVFFLFI